MCAAIRLLRIVGGLDPHFGGPSESAANACIASQRAGVQNTLVVPVAKQSVPRTEAVLRRLEEEAVNVLRFGVFPSAGRTSRRWGISPQLVRWLRRNIASHDVVHVHGAWGLSQASGVVRARRAGRPCVMSPHASLMTFDVDHRRGPLRPAAKKALKRLYLGNTATIIFASELEARDSISDTESVRTTVIPHPLRAALEIPPAAPAPGERPLTIGYLGRLHPTKNLELLVHAVKEASGVARLLIAGNGPLPYKRDLEALVAELAMTDRVEWLGFVEGDRRWPFIDSLDVLALPSQYECFGMVAAEAMARGVATLVSRNTGVAEIVGRYGCGIVTNPSVDDVAKALRRLEREEGLLRRLSGRAAFGARKELSMSAYGAAIRREYETLLQPADTA